MIVALLIFGGVCLLVGYYFFWMNLHSPLQTQIPAILWSIGALAILLALGGLIL